MRNGEGGGTDISSGTITTKHVERGDLPARLKVLYQGIGEVRERYAPDVAAVEIVFVNVNPQATLLLGQARGACVTALVSCDLAVAGRSSSFAVPGGRGGWFCTTPGVALARAVSRKHALEMLLTGDPIDAETALSWGLVNRIVDDAQVPAATRELLGRATRGSALSKALGKQAFYRQVDLDLRSAYDIATEAMAAASQTGDAKEGVASFLEKRPARFTGR